MAFTFHITQNGEPVPGLVFADGQTAAQFVKASLSAGYKILKVNDLDIDAELRKLGDGTYVDVPWGDNYYYTSKLRPTHVCRIAAKDKTQIEFLHPDTRVLTMIRPGRWLTQYMSHYLSRNEIEKYAKLVGLEPAALKFAVTADEIEDIYLRGPASCMSHSADDYDSPFHPVRIYAGPDLQLAYIEDPDEGIVGRALVWPERKTYGRIFSGKGNNGDYSYNRVHEVRMTEALNAAGFKDHPGLSGARMQRHPYDGGFVCPYIDNYGSVGDDGTWLTIGGGDIDAEETNGLSCNAEDEDENAFYCDCCDYSYNIDNRSSHSVRTSTGLWPSTATYCSSCDDIYAFTCAGDGEVYSDNVDSVTIEGTDDRYTQYYINAHPADFVCVPSTTSWSYDLWYEVGTDAHTDWLATQPAETEEPVT